MESSNFEPPRRSSLSDAELLAAIGENHQDEASVLAAMNLLETQTALRAIEDQALASWQDQMLRDGSPEALRALENARRQSEGLPPVEPLNPSGISATAEAPHVPLDSSTVQASVPAVELSPTDQSSGGVADALNALYGAPPLEQSSSFEDLLEDRTSASTGSAEENSTAFEELFPNQAAPTAVAARSDSTSLSDTGVSAWLHAFGFTTVSLSLVPTLLAVSLLLAGYSFSQAFWGLTIGIAGGAILLSLGSLGSLRVRLATPLVSRVVFGIRANAFPVSLLALIRLLALAGLLFYSLEVARNGLGSLSSSFSTQGIQLPGNFSVPFEIPAGFIAVLMALVLSLLGRKTRLVTAMIGTFAGLASVIASLGLQGLSTPNLTALVWQSDAARVFQVAGLVLALVAIFWLPAAGDYSRIIRAEASKVSVIFITLFSVGLLPLAVALGSLSAFNPAISGAIKSETVKTSAQAISLVSQQSELVFIGLLVSLLVIFSVFLKSVAVTLQSLFSLRSNTWMQVSAAVLAFAASSWISLNLAEVGFFYNAADYILVLAVPVWSWFGIYLTDSLLRRSQVHRASVTRSYGYYKNFSVSTVLVFVVATLLGLGFTQSDLIEFQWTGFFVRMFGLGNDVLVAAAGGWISFGFAILGVIATGIPRIRKQEFEIAAVEARRSELADIFDMGD